MKVLIGLTEHIGDIVACEPVARYLKGLYPDCHLSWAVLAPWRDLIDSNPFVDETIIVDCLTDWIRFSNHNDFDLVVDLHVNYRICQCCRIPLVKKVGNPLVNVYEWFDYGAILEAFSIGAGLPKLSTAPCVYISDADRETVDALGLPERFVVIHRSSNNPDKDWPKEKWLALVETLADLDVLIVEVGAGRDAQALDLPAGYRSLINKTSLLQLPEIIRRAQMFIGVDSSPAHFANAVGTPGVVLLGRLGYFQKYNPFTGFYARPSSLVKMVHNLTGPARDLNVDQVADAVRYVGSSSSLRTSSHAAEADRRIGGATSVDSDYLRLVESSGLFDADWYARFNPDVAPSGLDPLTHYLLVGVPERRSPGPRFDPAWYLAVNADVAAAKTEPLYHYVNSGKREGRLPLPSDHQWPATALPDPPKPAVFRYKTTTSTLLAPFEVPPSEADRDQTDEGAFPLVLAFYLPQFHPIMENDWAHGMGFTEWNNVVKAEPLFKGHYQPRSPGELGYYDLRSDEVLQTQLKLALDHGISGFCFYYYYFEGRKILYRPIENYIRSDAKAPFCFLWANENWTKRWDGGNRDVIIEQVHSDHDDQMFITELADTFRDDRYIRIDGKPLLLVYKPHLFPDVRRTTALWRQESERLGFPGLYLVMVDDWFEDLHHPRELGFDATYEIPSNIVHEECRYQETASLGLDEDFSGEIVDYHKFASFHASRPEPPYRRFKTVMLPWDNTPRYAKKAKVHINTDTDAFQNWLTQACVNAYQTSPRGERIVFLHSWNEWCEGTYIEPDGRYGRKFLEQARSAIEEARHLIGVLESGGVSQRSLSTLKKLMRNKEEGSWRILQIARNLAHYHRTVIDQTRETAGYLKAESLRWEAELGASRRHSANLQAALDAEVIASQGTHETLESAAAEALHWQAELAASRQHSANLQAKVDGEVSRREAAQGEALEQVLQMSAHVADLEERQRSLLAQDAAHLEALDGLRRQLDSLLNSTSWKAGKVARTLVDTVRGLKRHRS